MEREGRGFWRKGRGRTAPRIAHPTRALCAMLLAALLAVGCVPAAFGATQASETSDGETALVESAALAESTTLAETDESAAIATPEPTGVIAVVETGATALSADNEAENAADEAACDLEDAGLSVTDITELHDGSILLSAEPAEGQSIEDALAQAADTPGVLSVQLDYTYELIEGVDGEGISEASESSLAASLFSTLATALAFRPFDDPIALESSSEVSPNAYWLYDTGLVEAWEAAATGSSVAIALLDSGAALDHEDLAEAILDDLAWDAYNNAPLNASAHSNGDNGGHGTHVAGIVAAIPNNGIGTAGASYGASIVPVKVVNDTSSRTASTTSIIRAYEYLFDIIDEGLVEGLRVANLSLGSYSEALNDDLLRTTIERARNEYGIVSVCAGGNGQNGVAQTSAIYPADFDACVSVTALEADGTNISWSDYNEYKDISAPGRSIWSTYPASLSSTSFPYYQQSGTSMAAPIVAGAFALLFSICPDASVDEACEAIYATADEIIDLENDRRETSGSHGALNVAAAVEYLTGLNLDAGDFPDVYDDDWYADAVAYVAQRGIMTGYDEGADEFAGYFDPEKSMTRAEAAQILYNLYGNEEIAPAADKADVDQEEWYAAAVNWVVDAQLMNGYDDGSNEFGPDDPITREQFAIVIYNVSEVETIADPDKITTLPDSGSVSSWALEEVTWAVGNGLLNGFEISPGYRELLPQDPATRAMGAQMLMNAFEEGLL